MLHKKVEETIKRYGMLKKGDRVLVGVSGGPDSIFLLNTLYAMKDKIGVSIFAANLDHGIRGKASERDSEFVKREAKKLKVKCVHDKLRLTQDQLHGKLSVEEVLRLKRYEFFKRAARRFRANVLATGHTLDDQAETVLMRVIKGSTIKGLAGIPPVGKNIGLKIIRPLIETEKREILDFLDENNIPYRVDRTNLKERYFRNRLRNRVIPYLERYNPRLKRSLSLMAESLREDKEFIEETKKTKRALIKANGKCVSIKLKDIVIQPKTLQREILRDALVESGANIKKLNFRHWRDMREFLRHKRSGQSLDLPGGVAVRRGRVEILFERRG
ncbi:MAG: tRNA lysidine(34) synthetase TilS [Candidatus Omnitrophica bacterium]|nr:tRNA lysidine(34) synthetase TilS [Candidatus Omnitrophota bacterium]